MRQFAVTMLPSRARLLSTDPRVIEVVEVPLTTAAAPAETLPPAAPVSSSRRFTPQPSGYGDNGQSGTYTYDGAGNITAIGTDTYLYDTAQRLVRSVTRGAQEDYSYDAFGNRMSATGATNCLGQTTCAQTVTVDSSTNHLTTINGAAVTYDDAGNIESIAAISGSPSSVYSYDGTGMMTEATVGSDDRQFVYTADDERIAMKQGASWTWTVRDLSGKVLREFTSMETGGGNFAMTNRVWVKDYVWRDGLLLATTSSSGTLHYHLDHLGTPRLVTDANSVKVAEHAYYPFGAEIGLTPHETPEEAMKFTGHERDIVAGDGHTLDYMHARYYTASIGRFLCVDPVPGDPHVPQSWNVYAYVRNSPLQGTDPTGLTLQVKTADAAIGLCGMAGSDCADHIHIDEDGNVSVTATADELKANEALNLINDLVQSENKYGAWVGTSMPSGSKTLTLGPHEKDFQMINSSKTARTDIRPSENLALPTGFDGAVGIFSGYPSIATRPDGLAISMPMILFHELAENYYRTEKMKQYQESHKNAIMREDLLRRQQPDLGPFGHGSGKYTVTLQP